MSLQDAMNYLGRKGLKAKAQAQTKAQQQKQRNAGNATNA